MKKLILSIFAMLAMSISALSQSVTSTTVETIVKIDSLSTSEDGKSIDIYTVVSKSGTTTTGTLRVYVNDNSTLTGAQILGFYSITPSTKYIPFTRKFWYKNYTISGYSKTVSFMYDFVPATYSGSSTSVDLSNKKYIIVTIQPSSVSSEIFNLDHYKRLIY